MQLDIPRSTLRVLLRADASTKHGTGHVMRSLTLAEALKSRGHEVHLFTNESGILWLNHAIYESKLILHKTAQDSFDHVAINMINPDWIVIDSYEISITDINNYSGKALIMSIIDGDHRGVRSDLFLDQNLGAERNPWKNSEGTKLLAGSKYAMIRDSILSIKKVTPWKQAGDKPKVISFIGGTDPLGDIRKIGNALANFSTPIQSVLISSSEWINELETMISSTKGLSVVPLTPDLPLLIASADISISAAGSSAWELCSLGIPSIFVSVADNQNASLEQLNSGGYAFGMKREEFTAENLSKLLKILISDQKIRQNFSEKCQQDFDGRGKYRVVEEMERLLRERIN